MRENPQKHKEKSSHGMRLESVLDLVTTCPKCGGEIGLWSEEIETLCIFCEYRVFEREKTTH
jgi:DNA-directed RNA polymerase subunit RPC12/RpoP